MQSGRRSRHPPGRGSGGMRQGVGRAETPPSWRGRQCPQPHNVCATDHIRRTVLTMKRVGLRTILFGLSHVLRACARVDAEFRRRLRRNDAVAQIRLKDGSIGRWYALENGRVRSRAGLHPKPDVTISFRDVATALTFLVPPPDQSEIVLAAKQFRVIVDGKSELVVWFMQLLNAIPRVGMRYGTSMPDGTTRYTTCTNGGPLYVFVKDGRIVRITPIDFDERDAPSWTIRARGQVVHALAARDGQSARADAEVDGVFRQAPALPDEARRLRPERRAQSAEPRHLRVRAHQLGRGARHRRQRDQAAEERATAPVRWRSTTARIISGATSVITCPRCRASATWSASRACT